MDLGLTSLPAQLARILFFGIFAAYWFGYAPARGLLPAEWQPYRWLLMPSIGLVFFAVLAQPLALVGINSPTLILILFPLALAANGLAVWRAPRPNSEIARREIILPLVIGAGTVLLGVMPLLAYGYITVIGYNVDGTTYVAQAEFAKQFGLATASIAKIPSPFAETVVRVIRLGIGAVGPLWISVVSRLLGNDSFLAFAPLLVLWHGLSFLTVFVLYRTSFQLNFWTSIGALCALALNGVRLLIPLDNFAPHTFALALLPLEWMTTYRYFETRAWRIWLLASLTLAAQILSYPEATPFYVLPMLGVLGLMAWQDYRGGRALRAPRVAVWRWIQIGLGSVLLGPTAYLALANAFMSQVGQVLSAEGGTIATFISLPEAFGVDALRELRHPWLIPWDTNIRGAWDIAAWVGVGILLVLFAIGLMYSVRTERRLLAAGGIALPILLIWMLVGPKYAYGFFKTFATSLVMFLAVIAIGAERWFDWLRASATRQRWGMPSAAGLALLFVLLVTSMGWFENTLAQRAPVVTRKLIQLSRDKQTLPPQSSVFLVLTREPNPRMFWAAYLLRDHPLFGDGRLAYTDMHNTQEGVRYDYALLNQNQDPREFDYSPDAHVWEDRWTVLYTKP